MLNKQVNKRLRDDKKYCQSRMNDSNGTINSISLSAPLRVRASMYHVICLIRYTDINFVEHLISVCKQNITAKRNISA